MPKAMIVSVGGSPQPLVFAIKHHRPALVCFVVSEKSVDMVPQIKEAAGLPFGDIKELTPNAEDLLACYGAAIKAAGRVEAQGYAPGDIVVDYTGGTKSMTAALVLATVARGYAFSYVGGEERNKGNLGVVVNGKERLLEILNPWEVLAVEEQARLAWLFNHSQFAAAEELLAAARGKARQDARLGRLFACLAEVVGGYAAWDSCAHRKAGELLRPARQRVKDCALFLQDEGLQTFTAEMEQSLTFLDRMTQASGGFQRLCREMVVDLVANAERRAAEGKYDDAVARLYRALEMAAQAALAGRRPPIDTGAVPLTAVPAELREEFARRYADPREGAVQLPLFAAYRLLATLADPLGQRFMAAEERIQGLLAARNHSILAHGLIPLGSKAYEGLLAELLALLEVKREDLPRFPRLELQLFPARQ